MNKERIEKNLIVKLSFEFGVAITGFCDQLHQERKFVIANQLLRAGLSLVQTSGRLKTLKVWQTLFINLK
jgi:hypothetical protein